MTDETSEKDEIVILDADDGSAVVDLPVGAENHDTNEGEEPKKEEAKSDGGIVDDDDAEHPNDDEELRAAKRNRRRAKKDLIRRTNQEKDARLVALARQNEEMARRLSELERNTKSADLVRIDKGIEDAQTRLEYAKMKLAEATQTSDGQGMVEAQTLWQEAQEQVRQLTALKKQADQEPRQSVQQPRQQDHQRVDPIIQRNATDWMSKNTWYDPNGSDRDSRIAKKVDEVLIAEEWDPRDPDYWVELDSRLKKSLPHRYNLDDGDVRDVKKPRNVVGSSGREASSSYGGANRTQFVLSPERVRAMKETGAWDDPKRKKAIIESFMKYDRANAGRNN